MSPVLRGRRPLFALLALLVALTALLGATSGAAGAVPRADERSVDRVLIVSVPTLSWEELDTEDAPNLNALLDESAIADLSTRAVVRRTTPGDGYATLDAGARARGARGADGLAFDVGEVFSGYPAEEVFGRRTGQVVSEGVVNLGLPQIVAENERLPYDALIGALGQTLSDEGVHRAVIGNADGSEQELDVEFGRAVGGGLMDTDGLVPGGSVGMGLLQEDPGAPFGRRLDLDAVDTVFREEWREDAVVLVEASDLVRADAYRSRVTKGQRARMRADAIEWTDDLVARLLTHVDPEHDAVMVVGPYHASTGVHLTVAGLRAPEIEPGLLKSAVTRRVGFVTLADTAPTVLDLLGIEAPDQMEGRPWERAATGGTAEERREWLIAANDGALFRDDLVGPVSTLFVVAQLALWVLAVIALRRHRPRLRRVIEVASLSVLALLPATYLAGLLPFERLGSIPYWLFLVTGSVLIGLVCDQLRRLGSVVDPLIGVLSLIVGLLVIDLFIGAPLQLNTTFGYTPTIAGRFAGLGNLAFAQLAAASLILAGLVAWRVGGRRGAWLGVAILAVAVVADGSPFWGSDVGGVLSFVPGAGITAVALLGWKIRWRTIAVWVVGGVLAMVAMGFLDLARPEEQRTHLGRLFERIGDEGFGAFVTVIFRKLDANLSVLTSSEWILMVPVVFAFVLYLIWRAPGRLHRIQELIPQERASLYGFTVVAVLGFALNDSGIAIPGVMLGVLNASLVYLLLVTDDLPDPLAEPPPVDTDEPLGAEVVLT
ncbi:MAG: hypothetical protein JNK12_24600 [Acidimicrobiales bacterium]|nr:hypothetical protein [Acidimicrobiales bacterium]